MKSDPELGQYYLVPIIALHSCMHCHLRYIYVCILHVKEVEPVTIWNVIKRCIMLYALISVVFIHAVLQEPLHQP